MNQLSDQTEWLAIVNPNAGNGKGHKDWNLIAKLLERKNIFIKTKITEAKGHAAMITHEAVREGFRKIITIGGDGTLNEVVNGIFTDSTCPPEEISLALIPVGTGNDWGRMFGIPSDYEKSRENNQ